MAFIVAASFVLLGATITPAAAATAPCAGPQAAPSESAGELADLLARARAAHGVERFAALGKHLVVTGSAHARGMDATWTTRLASDGRFVTSISSRLPVTSGFDGRVIWSVDPTGIPRRSWFEEREHALLEAAIASGAWCLEGGPLVVLGLEPAEPAAPARTIRLRARDGELEARLELDAATALPAALDYRALGAPQRWTWKDWREAAGGLAIAHEFVIDDDGQRDVTNVTSAQLADPDDAAFAMPAGRPRDVTFDPAVPARLDGKVTRSRHLVVRTQLDGKDVGWFIFDSGAGATCIDPELADELGMDAFGRIRLGGGGAARIEARFREGRWFALGPVTVERPRFVELETSGFRAALGEEIAGICGYDLLQRVVAAVDISAGRVELFDPATFARDGVTWRELVLGGNHPHVRCTFEHEGEEEGLFRLDTGAGGASVLFHAPFVRRIGLLEGRDTTPLRGMAGVGGELQARAGRLSWFELGGLTIDEPAVVFTEDERGAFADPWTAGTIGSVLLDRFELILDYPHSRIGFVPRAGDERARGD